MTRIAIILCLLFASTPAFAEVDGPDFFRVVGVSSDDVLNIRSGPSARHAIIGTIPHNGRRIRNLGCRGGMSFQEWQDATPEERRRARYRRWCRIEYRGTRGWANGGYLAED